MVCVHSNTLNISGRTVFTTPGERLVANVPRPNPPLSCLRKMQGRGGENPRKELAVVNMHAFEHHYKPLALSLGDFSLIPRLSLT